MSTGLIDQTKVQPVIVNQLKSAVFSVNVDHYKMPINKTDIDDMLK